MIVLVCGGRDFEDSFLLYQTLDALRPPPTKIVEGGQRKKRNGETVGGADYWANRWARARGVPCVTIEAAWADLKTAPVVTRKNSATGAPYNAAAGGIRNQRMLNQEHPDLVVAFCGGSGTADMVKRAEAAGVPVRRVGW